MSPRLVTVVLAVLLALAFVGTLSQPAFARSIGHVKMPIPIVEGPQGSIRQQASGNSYWFQVGAIGDSSSSGYQGTNVTIRTVYDVANNDAHSYWVGGYVGPSSSLAFIQVGYLTTISTDGSPYCCAWFWEYFPANSGTNCGAICAPHIGPEDSAGPIGAWHEYSMDSNLDGTWSFYMDGKLLGTTTNLGATNSGSNPPAWLAEVADTADNKDILGPAEFVNMTYKGQVSGWQTVPHGVGKIGYGAPSATLLPNPYGSVAITGVDDDFLAGSGLPAPAAGGGTVFWHSTMLLPYHVSFSFQDTNGVAFTPDWISFHDSADPSSRVFYSKYSDQIIAQSSGLWTLDHVLWHNVNVAPLSNSTLDVTTASVLNVTGRVFPLNVKIIGYLFSYPVSGAQLLTSLPDSLSLNATSGQNGQASFEQLPVGSYSVRVVVPRGIQASFTPSLTSSMSLTVRVVGLPELLTAVTVPVVIGTVLIVYAVRKERARRRLMESMATVLSPTEPPTVQPPSEPPPSTSP